MPNKIYYISDTHFSHANIIKFDGRPFFDVDDMDQTLINNWNQTVHANDTIYILGDFCWLKEARWKEILDQLKGHKVLILGNHDLRNPSQTLRSKFADIKDYKEIDDQGRKVLISHYPILCYKSAYKSSVYMLYGHVHMTKEYDFVRQWSQQLQDTHTNPWDNLGQLYNVGCMLPYMDYRPRTLDEIIKACEGNPEFTPRTEVRKNITS